MKFITFLNLLYSNRLKNDLNLVVEINPPQHQFPKFTENN